VVVFSVISVEALPIKRNAEDNSKSPAVMLTEEPVCPLTLVIGVIVLLPRVITPEEILASVIP
jgi:hypothetical protein